MRDKPLAYFITSTTYGTWLHGDDRKSVVIKDGLAKEIESNAGFFQYQRNSLKHPQVTLNSKQRQIVLKTITDHCQLKGWPLYTAHVRSNHFHLLIQSEHRAEKVTSDLKAWCTRRLREAGFDLPKVWTRQASTVYVWRHEKLIEKARYIIQDQGRPMSVYIDPQFSTLI